MTKEIKISFEYQGEKFCFELNGYGLEEALDVDYDSVCRSPYDDCDHDYNRCMVITNISKNSFDLHGYCQNYLKGGTDASKKKVTELVCRSLVGICFEDYIDCEGEGDYYGEYLKKSANISGISERVVENFKIDFTNVQVIE